MMIENLTSIGVSNYIIGVIYFALAFVKFSLEMDDLFGVLIISLFSFVLGFFWFICIPIYIICYGTFYILTKLHKFIRKFKRD